MKNMIVVSDTITQQLQLMTRKIIWTNVRIYLPEYIFGLMTEAGIWKKYIPTPIWNEISPFTTHPMFCSVSIANNWDFKIDRKYSFGWI
jgi:hypothetical protein